MVSMWLIGNLEETCIHCRKGDTPSSKHESENLKKESPQKSATTLQKDTKEPNPPPGSPEPQVLLSDKDLVRMMAEVHFINGEVCQQLEMYRYWTS